MFLSAEVLSSCFDLHERPTELKVSMRNKLEPSGSPQIEKTVTLKGFLPFVLLEAIAPWWMDASKTVVDGCFVWEI